MLLASTNMRRVVGGSVTILGVVDGIDIKVFYGLITASSKTASGDTHTDATGPGDAGVSVVFAGNRFFAFKLDGKATLGARALGNFTKSNAAMTLKFDDGETWAGAGVIESMVRGTNLNKTPGEVRVVVQGMISSNVITPAAAPPP